MEKTAAELLEEMSQENAPAPDPVPRVGRVEVDYTTADGQCLAGSFDYELPLTPGQLLKIQILAFKLRGGLSPEVVGVSCASLSEQIATLAVCCTSVPEWARDDNGRPDWESLPMGILNAVHQEVASHNARFLLASGHLGSATAPRK